MPNTTNSTSSSDHHESAEASGKVTIVRHLLPLVVPHTHLSVLQADNVPVSWHQSTDEVFIKVPVDDSVRGKEVSFEVHPTRLQLAVRGDTLLEGSLTDAGAINVDSEYQKQ